jgi:hypothetical protein
MWIILEVRRSSELQTRTSTALSSLLALLNYLASKLGALASDLRILADSAAAAHCSSSTSYTPCTHRCNGHICGSSLDDIDINRLGVSISSFVSNRREYNSIIYSLANSTQLLRYDYDSNASSAINVDVHMINDNAAYASSILNDEKFFASVLDASPYQRGYLAPIQAAVDINGTIIQPIDPTFAIGR